MAESTGISCADATFNPWIGCEKVSPGCAHCYAEPLVTGRMARPGTWGADGVRQVTSPSNWKKPLRWERLAKVGFLPDGSENPDGHRPRIFCASLADVFEDRDELDEPRDRLFQLIYETPRLDWLILTKRPEFARDWLEEFYSYTGRWEINGPSSDGIPLTNIWIGVSIENARHTWRADVLREIPAAVRFISAEPLLGSLYTTTPEPAPRRDHVSGTADGVSGGGSPSRVRASLDLTDIDWIIIGGESGPGARPFHIGHAREIIVAARLERGRRYESRATDHAPAIFVKQLGANPTDGADHRSQDPRTPAWDWTLPIHLHDRKGGDWSEWPADLQILEFPRALVQA